MNETDWNNLYKIRIANSDDSFQKHEIIKLLIVMKTLKKYKSNKNWLRIYTEFKLNGVTADVYVEDIKKKSIICYEIQKELTPKWLKEKTEQYKHHEQPFFTLDFIPIPLKEAPNNIEELNKWLDSYIF